LLKLERLVPYFNLIRRRQARRLVATLPAVARGALYAFEWKNWRRPEQTGTSVEDNHTSPGEKNPLERYFDSIATGRGIWKWTHYWNIYHRHLQKFIGKDVHLVEVGVYSGGSLAMWKSYFGGDCRVYGVDIEPACSAYQDETTRIFIGDQADRSFWNRFKAQVPRVDILIDDGGHLPEQQIVTLEEMLPHISPGGVYLCEDVHSINNRFCGYVHGLVDALNATHQKEGTELAAVPSPFQTAVSSVHLYPFAVVIEKTDTALKQFVAPKHGTEWQPFL
jgi:hypothetical protein